MPQETSRTARIEARISPEALAMLKQAAALQGRSVSDFMTTAAQAEAYRTIQEAQTIRLSLEDQRRFVDQLLNPPPLSPAMKRARDAHKRLIQE
ncbi:MAG: DUF1778 domain-containing protein [Rhizomicrobium sp.]